MRNWSRTGTARCDEELEIRDHNSAAQQEEIAQPPALAAQNFSAKHEADGQMCDDRDPSGPGSGQGPDTLVTLAPVHLIRPLIIDTRPLLSPPRQQSK